MRVGLLVAGTALGLVSGVAAVMLHQYWAWLVVAMVAAAATSYALGPGAGRVGFALGWGMVVLRAAITTSAGDFLVPANTTGWALLLGSFVLVLGSLVTARPPARAAGVGEEQPTPT